ncbi:hypothetical protein M9H77_22578 [Catharanthus roseus]|uniref:Uncharacterized protein n=1 Tax=Catharanthus roseus TaxID=4058 RepID=A0ACC0ASD7_CATRO|nr:hypothetical protein M9H77_22578 [Catharanthus roseus]
MPVNETDKPVASPVADVGASNLSLPNGTKNTSCREGSIFLSSRLLHNVLYVPNLKCHLVSIPLLIRQHPSYGIADDTIVIHDRATRTKIRPGRLTDGVFIFHLSKLAMCFSKNDEKNENGKKWSENNENETDSIRAADLSFEVDQHTADGRSWNHKLSLERNLPVTVIQPLRLRKTIRSEFRERRDSPLRNKRRTYEVSKSQAKDLVDEGKIEKKRSSHTKIKSIEEIEGIVLLE